MQIVLFACSLFTAAACSQSNAAEPPPADLDVLLRLLCQRGVVNNERLKLGITPSDQTSQAWIDGVAKLSGSRTPAVAEAVRRLKPAIELLNEAIAIDKQAEAAKRNRKSHLGEMNLLGAQIELMHGPDEFELDEMVRRRMITREEADERISQRSQLKVELIKRFGQDLVESYAISSQAIHKTYHRRNRADVLRTTFVREVLGPALTARAGAESQQPPLEVHFGTARKGDNIYAAGIGDRLGYVTLHSNSTTELSQLTLLVEIQTTVGNRFELIYLPVLPPNSSAHFAPILLSQESISGLLQLNAKKVEVTGVRYTAWCKEFCASNVEVKTVSTEELVNEVRLQTVRPGSVYVSRGGADPSLTQIQFMEAKRAGRNTDEPIRRFIITFKSLKPIKQGYEVTLDLTDHYPKDRKTSYTQHVRGVFQLPPVKLSEPEGTVLNSVEAYRFGEVVPEEKKTIVLKLNSGREEWTLQLRRESWNDNEPEWFARGGPAPMRQFVPDGVLPADDSPEGIARNLLQAAVQAQAQGKFDEAQRMLEKIVVDYPGTTYQLLAQHQISEMDSRKERYSDGQKKLAQMRAAQEAYNEKQSEKAKLNEIALKEYQEKAAQVKSEMDAANKLAETGKFEAAWKAYQKFVSDHPEEGYVNQGLMQQFLLARKMSEAGKYTDAKKVYEKIIADHPASPSAQLSEGDLSRLEDMKKRHPQGIAGSSVSRGTSPFPIPPANTGRTTPFLPPTRGVTAPTPSKTGTKLTREQQLAQTRAQAEKDKFALNLVTQAKQAIARKNYTLARGYLQQAINFSPDSGAGKQAKKLMEQLEKKK